MLRGEEMYYDIRNLHDQVEKSAEQGRSLLRIVTSHELHQRPSSSRWSAGECVAHLNLANRKFGSAIRQALGSITTRNVPLSYPQLELAFLRSLEPPVRIPVKTQAALMPATIGDSESLLADWEESHDQLREMLTAASDADLVRTKVSAPVASFARVSLGSMFAIIAAHNRRHLWQASRALAALEATPSAA
jgi:hypothetical protein